MNLFRKLQNLLFLRMRQIHAIQDGQETGTVVKSFIAGSSLTQKAVTSASFDNDLANLFAKAAKLNEFLCKAVGLPF